MSDPSIVQLLELHVVTGMSALQIDVAAQCSSGSINIILTPIVILHQGEQFWRSEMTINQISVPVIMMFFKLTRKRRGQGTGSVLDSYWLAIGSGVTQRGSIITTFSCRALSLIHWIAN